MLAFLTMFKKVLSTIKAIIIWLFKNPLVLIIVILCGIGLFQYLTISDKNTEIANLNKDIETLNLDLIITKNNLKSANDSIDKQNESIKKSIDSKRKLDEALQLAKLANDKLEKDIKFLLDNSNDSPVESKEAFEWLRYKAKELKSWKK